MMIAITGSGLAGAATPSADSRAQAFLSPASASKPVQTGAASIESLPLTKAAPVHSAPATDLIRTASGGHARTVGVGADSCPSARKALAFYRSRVEFWRDKMGAGRSGIQLVTAGAPRTRGSNPRIPCPRVRYLAERWRAKAHAARVAYLAWYRYQWEYRRWMPGWMIRLGQCEMSLDWSRQWGGYEGAFAFATGTWDQYRLPSHPSDAWRATPRQQMEVVYRVARAVTVGGAWGCWRGDQHAWVRGGLPESGFRG